ncbi:MAG TPA: glycosyltransferase family 87 protein [Terracidiphilus sp.]|nr:glycosyltransferase family 87 protein [Terracidiphilus sp.]
MKVKRWVSLASLLLSAAISIVWGSSSVPNQYGTTDFRAVYYGTRCLLQHHNPYSVSELERVVRDEHGERPSETVQQHQAVTLCINLPTTFLFVAPFAVLPFGIAQALWLALLAGLFILAGFLIWNLSESFSPAVSLLLICIVLANSEVIFLGGNTAGIAVCFCLVAVWCFLQERFVMAGVLCMALSLAIKPHDSGFVWLYFLLARGGDRKRAMQSLIVTIVMGISALLWVSLVASHWMQDWHANFAVSAHGGINDPGPTSSVGFHNLDPVIDLQSVISVFRDDPRIYNSISYLVCGPLLLLWAIATLRFRFSRARAWLALAAIVPLTLLVTYHRPWDAKLLLLTVPACAMLWAEGGLIGWLALLVNTAGVVCTGDIPLAILGILTRNLRISTVRLSGRILTVLTARPIPLMLLIMGVFYLWVYVRRTPGLEASTGSESSNQEPLAPVPLETGSPTLALCSRENLLLGFRAVFDRKRG